MDRKRMVGFSGLFLLIALPGILTAPSFAQLRGQHAVELIKKEIEERGVEAARMAFTRLLKEKGRDVFDEAEFLAFGNGCLQGRKILTAVAVFEMSVEAFPQSFSALRLLAHAYYMSGDEESSLKTQGKMMSVSGKARLAGFLEKYRDSLAVTAEGVIGRSLEATGGREAWEAVKTMVVKFSIQNTSGERLRMIRMYKRPHLYRQGMEGSSDFTATDGEMLWQVRGGKWKEARNTHIQLISMDNWLLGYEGIGISYEFLGFDHIGGIPVYHLQRSFPNGFKQDLYFSATTNLLTEIRADYVQHAPFMKSFMSLWNYREVEGVKIPFVFIRNMGSLEPPHGGVVEEVRINVPLEDGLFLPPGEKK